MSSNNLHLDSEVTPIPPTYLYQRETEYFGWTPLSYVDSMITIVNKYSHSALDSLQEFIDAELGDCMENEKGMQLTASLLESSVDKNFDRWELYCLQQIFHLPADVQLPGDDQYDWSFTEEHEAQVDDKIAEMRKKLLQVQKSKALIAANEQSLERQIQKLQQYNEIFSFIPSLLEKSRVKSLADESAFVSSQISKLAELSTECKDYDSKVDEVSRLKAKSKSRRAANSLNVKRPSALKEDELYEKLTKSISMDSLQVLLLYLSWQTRNMDEEL